MNISAFSERLKDLRIDAGMTSDQLAKKIGVTKSTISFWENGVNEPKASYIVAVAKVFSVLPTIFWGSKTRFKRQV